MEELHMVSNDVAETVPPLTKDEEDALDILTPREEEILLLVASGAKNKNIAENLCLSPHTVRGHISSIFSKIGVENRLQAMLWGTKYLLSMKERLNKIIQFGFPIKPVFSYYVIFRFPNFLYKKLLNF